jgi:hypothetical protein
MDPELKLFEQQKTKGNFGNLKGRLLTPSTTKKAFVVLLFIESEDLILNDL